MRAFVAGPGPMLALSLGPDRGLDDALTTAHGPSTAREKGLAIQVCPDFNSSGTPRPAALTTEGRASPLRAVGKVEHGLGWRPRR